MVTLFLVSGKRLVFPTGTRVAGHDFGNYTNVQSVTIFGEGNAVVGQFLIGQVAGYVIGEGSYQDAADTSVATEQSAAPEAPHRQSTGDLTGYERGREG